MNDGFILQTNLFFFFLDNADISYLVVALKRHIVIKANYQARYKKYYNIVCQAVRNVNS